MVLSSIFSFLPGRTAANFFGLGFANNLLSLPFQAHSTSSSLEWAPAGSFNAPPCRLQILV